MGARLVFGCVISVAISLAASVLMTFSESIISEVADCIGGCVQESSKNFSLEKIPKGFFQEEDFADYADINDWGPVVYVTKRTCRILDYTQDCISNCGSETGNDFQFNGTASLNILKPICGGDNEKAWRRVIEKCLFVKDPNDPTGEGFLVHGYKKPCRAKCRNQDLPDALSAITNALKLVAKTGSRAHIQQGLKKTCKFLECWIPCQGDYYQKHCPDEMWGKKAGEFVANYSMALFKEIRKKTSIWRTRFWPEECEAIMTDGFLLTSQKAVTLFPPPNLESDRYFKKDPGLRKFLLGIGFLGDSAACLSISNWLILAVISLLLFR